MKEKIDTKKMKKLFPTIDEEMLELTVDAFNKNKNMRLPYMGNGSMKEFVKSFNQPIMLNNNKKEKNNGKK